MQNLYPMQRFPDGPIAFNDYFYRFFFFPKWISIKREKYPEVEKFHKKST